MALFNIGDEIHILTENNNMYHIKRHTVTNIIQGGYYEIFDGEKKDSVSIHSNNIFKNCNDAFKERDRRIKSKKQEALNNEILLKQTYKPRNNFDLRNPNEKKFVEYKPARRRYNPRYDGDARIRPVSKEIESKVRVIKNSSGIVIGVEKY